MLLEDIEIHVGKITFAFRPIRQLEVKCEATNALRPAPTIEEVNGRLRALAAKLGANAIVNVEYKSGVSLTSWKSIKATGMAGIKQSDETACNVCGETIKITALKCRFCSDDRAKLPLDSPAKIGNQEDTFTPSPAQDQAIKKSDHIDMIEIEPLRDNNNPVIWIMLGGLLIFIVSMMLKH